VPQKAKKTRPDLVPSTTTEPGVETMGASTATHLGSYTWIKERMPSIYVPGSAPRWKPRKMPMVLPVASWNSRQAVDHDAARIPNAPLEPLFHAVGGSGGAFADVDVVCSSHVLETLFWLARGGELERSEWFVRAYVRGQPGTLLLEPWESPSTVEIEKGDEVPMVRDRCTRWDEGLDEAFAHRSVVRYPLGGLQCVVVSDVDVRFGEEDAAQVDRVEDMDVKLASPMESVHAPLRKPAYLAKPPRSNHALTVPLPRMENLDLVAMPSEDGVETTTPWNEHARIVALHAGEPLHLARRLPGLFFSRTPRVVVTHHRLERDGPRKGEVMLCRVGALDVRPWMDAWARSNETQATLRRVESMLGKIRAAVMRRDAMREQRGGYVVTCSRNVEHRISEMSRGENSCKLEAEEERGDDGGSGGAKSQSEQSAAETVAERTLGRKEGGAKGWTRVIRVFESRSVRVPLSERIVERFWGEKGGN
jgi:hypothetical protein